MPTRLHPMSTTRPRRPPDVSFHNRHRSHFFSSCRHLKYLGPCFLSLWRPSAVSRLNMLEAVIQTWQPRSPRRNTTLCHYAVYISVVAHRSASVWHSASLLSSQSVGLYKSHKLSDTPNHPPSENENVLQSGFPAVTARTMFKDVQRVTHTSAWRAAFML